MTRANSDFKPDRRYQPDRRLHKTIHSFPPTRRLPRKRKSWDADMGGRDCKHDLKIYKANNDDNCIHSLPSPLRLPKKRKSGKGIRGEGDCYDPIEGELHPMHMLNKKAQNTLEIKNRFSPLMNREEEQEDILRECRRGDTSPERKKLRLVCFEDFGEFCNKNSDLILSNLFDNSICVTYKK